LSLAESDAGKNINISLTPYAFTVIK
jgi:hypothetical protein